MKDLGILTIQNISQAVETLSGGQRKVSQSPGQRRSAAGSSSWTSRVTPQSHTMNEAVAIMTGAVTVPREAA